MGIFGRKNRSGDTPQEALRREILEELKTEIAVGKLIDTIEYNYPTFHLSMEFFGAKILFGDFILTEHVVAKWLTKTELDSVAWLPADIMLIDKIKATI